MNSATTIQSESATHDAEKPRPQPRFGLTIVVVLLAGVALFRIGATYKVYCQIVDEPEHLAAGLEWWQRGTYTADEFHVPLAPVMMATLPYWTGARLRPGRATELQGNAYLQGPGSYFEHLTLARLGILPLFVLGIVVVAAWSRRVGGNVVAIASVLLFTTTPAVLAHAGLATTDTAAEAAYALALFAFVTWFAKPTWKSALALGVAGGLALSAKMSTVAFLLVAGGLIVIARAALRGRDGNGGATSWLRWRDVLAFVLAVLCAFAIVWAMYRFATAPLALVAPRVAAKLPGAMQHLPVPAPGLWNTVHSLDQFAHEKNTGYFFGRLHEGGSPWFFPVALLVKTPIALLLLIALGAVVQLRGTARDGDWTRLAPLLGAAAVMSVAVCSNINIGLRHILPMYPLLAIVAGSGVAWLWTRSRMVTGGRRSISAAALTVLLGWHLASGIRTHPDYLPYFNEFARGHGERILVDSDLDWGQDLLRLSSELRKRHIDEVWLGYFGSADPEYCGLFERDLRPRQPVTGWVAISEFYLKEEPRDYAWLNAYQPVARVGQSILLYHIQPPRQAR